MKKKKVWFLVNPISGTENKKRIVEMIPRFMDTEKFDTKVCYTEYSGHAAELAREAVFNSVDVV
ncbi:MAG: diacylglycerol kinase family protein, partial [Bacteroidaceae bacterium]|nr:diacylglycerol kinase family protein [Bacteroidaceae bacterium]